MSFKPNEVRARPSCPKHYAKVAGEQDNLRRPYQVPAEYTKDTYHRLGEVPPCPLIVFINSRSGGQQGADLTLAFSRSLGRAQVFDLSSQKPRDVLIKMWANFDAAEASGDIAARIYQKRLRILAAGGDGTIAWVLGTIKSLDLRPVPAVAIMPMGTGNDLARTFDWGGAFDADWINSHKSLFITLKRVCVAPVEDLDCWRVTMSLPRQELLGKLPYSLQRLPSDPAAGEVTVATGMFWNYLSVGLDAQAAHGFHSLREHKPYLTAGRLSNQAWYTLFSCSTGWFCCTKPFTSRAKLQVQQPGSNAWEDVPVGNEVKALVVLNLQSYAGGRNLWGPNAESIQGQTTHQPASCCDGLLEVVGLTNGYHTGLVMASQGNMVHAKRICQVSALRVQLQAKYLRSDGMPSHAYLQVDGEPWVQDVPSSRDEEFITVEVNHCGTSKVLRNVGGLHSTRMSSQYIENNGTAGIVLTADEISVEQMKEPVELPRVVAVQLAQVAEEQVSEPSPGSPHNVARHTSRENSTVSAWSGAATATETATTAAQAGSSTLTSFSSTLR